MDKYRAGVGVMIINKNKQIYLFERSDKPDNWQCPEGGLDLNEDAQTGAFREMQEEVGISPNNVKLLTETKDFIPYIIPAEFKPIRCTGQKKKFFLVEFLGNKDQIKFDSGKEIEFKQFKLVYKEELLDYIINFKKDLYAKVLQEFEPFLKKPIIVYL
jgi:putative (di)nucleoside polyphosphate hydrolase